MKKVIIKALSIMIIISILMTGGIIQVFASDDMGLPMIPNTDRGYSVYWDGFSFKNFKDNEHRGHCFGMSMVSAAYFHDIIEESDLYGYEGKDLIEYSLTNAVRLMLCKYQSIQGSTAKKAIVAGGSYYLNKKNCNIVADWNDVVNYASNGGFCSGALQISIKKIEGNETKGHAVNLIEHKVVNGQDRLYAYDSNFPNEETYFYMTNGKVYQAPKSTFDGAIDSIALRDIFTYFEAAKSFDRGRAIYADDEMIYIEGAEAYPMECGDSEKEYIMYEVPENVSEITIVPLTDGANFQYLDNEYSFNEIDENTVGKLKLSSEETESVNPPIFTVTENNAVDFDFRIQEPSRKEIRNRDGIRLHANIEGTAPDEYYVIWNSSNDYFDIEADDSVLKIIARDKGYTTFTAILYSGDGTELARDTVEMYSKSGFFDKIGGFFRNLFGLTNLYDK